MAAVSWMPSFLQDLSRSFRELPKGNKIALASAASASFYFLVWPSLQKRLEFFALKNMHKITEPSTREHKEKLFSDLEDLPKDENGDIVILELGIGTGINLKFYPKGVHLIASDLHALGEKEIADECASLGLNFKQYIVTGAEDLSMLKSGSVSAVVMTLVLCSVENMEAALREIKRVLVPGGCFYFFEHTRNFEPNKLRTLAQFVMWLPQITMFYCSTRRDQLRSVINVFGVDNVQSDEILVQPAGVNSFLLFAVAPHVVGKAIRSG